MVSDEVKPDLSGTAAARGFGGELRSRAGARPEVPNGLSVGDKRAGKIVSIVNFGVFVAIADNFEGLVHRSVIEGVEPKNREAGDLQALFALGQAVEVEVATIDHERNRVGFKLVG